MKTTPGNFGKTPGSVTINKLTIGQNLPTSLGKMKLAKSDALASYGPEILGLQYKMQNVGGGPGDPPEGFLGAATTIPEWYLYWALLKLLGPEDPSTWEYQGHTTANSQVRGFARVDFIIFQPLMDKGIRVQTYRFHHNVGPWKQTYDVEQYIATQNKDFRMIDVNEQDYVNDETGQSAIALMLEAINGLERPNPLATGFVIGTG